MSSDSTTVSVTLLHLFFLVFQQSACLVACLGFFLEYSQPMNNNSNDDDDDEESVHF